MIHTHHSSQFLHPLFILTSIVDVSNLFISDSSSWRSTYFLTDSFRKVFFTTNKDLPLGPSILVATLHPPGKCLHMNLFIFFLSLIFIHDEWIMQSIKPWVFFTILLHRNTLKPQFFYHLLLHFQHFFISNTKNLGGVKEVKLYWFQES